MSNTSSTVRKALTILEGFSAAPEGLTLTEIASRTRINKATALRLCATLEKAGFIQRDPQMVYHVGRKVWALAQVYRREFDLESLVRPVLVGLRDATGESASFYVRDGEERICVFRENSRHTIRHHVDEGVRLPLSKGVVGRVLLASSGRSGPEFDRIRRQGYLAAQGREPDTGSVAAPVLDRAGGLVGSVVVSGPQSRFDAHRQTAAVPLILSACSEIRDALPTADKPAERAEPGAAPRRPGRRKSNGGAPALPLSDGTSPPVA